MVDYFFLGLVLLSIGAGFVRGFFKEAISLATWILATFLALKFGDLFSGFFDNYFGSPVLQLWAGRVSMFVLIVIAGTLTNHLINALLDNSGLSTTDHFLGMIFGLVRGVLLVGLLVILGEGLALDEEQWWKDSQVLPYFTQVTALMRDWFDSGKELLQDLDVSVQRYDETQSG
ncbi:MAG: CvpA family protein [Gammaproteobacteria bacterium]|nr:CvpA family protein [Gammaproteobacteria bacterium]